MQRGWLVSTIGLRQSSGSGFQVFGQMIIVIIAAASPAKKTGRPEHATVALQYQFTPSTLWPFILNTHRPYTDE